MQTSGTVHAIPIKYRQHASLFLEELSLVILVRDRSDGLQKTKIKKKSIRFKTRLTQYLGSGNSLFSKEFPP